MMPSMDPGLIKLLLALTIAVELGGGLMLLIGWQARWAAVIFLWMIPVTCIFHSYWGLPPEQMQMQCINFQKNMAVMDGMLFVIAYGSGADSLGKVNC